MASAASNWLRDMWSDFPDDHWIAVIPQSTFSGELHYQSYQSSNVTDLLRQLDENQVNIAEILVAYKPPEYLQ